MSAWFPGVFRKKEEEVQQKKITVLSTVILVLLGVIAVILAPVAAYEWRYQDRIYQGVEIDGVSVSGFTVAEAVQKLNGYADALKATGIPFHYGTHSATLDAVVFSATDPDISREILYFDVERMAQEAYAVGREGFFVQNLLQQGKAIFDHVHVPVRFTLREDDLRTMLHQEFGYLEKPAKSAEVLYVAAGAQITTEQEGTVIQYADAVNKLRSAISLRSIDSVALQVTKEKPQITKADIEKNPELIDSLLQLPDLTITGTLKGKAHSWVIGRQALKNFASFKKEGENISLSLDSEKLRARLSDINQEIAVPPQNAQFVMEDGKVTKFTASEEGREMDIDAMMAQIQADFVTGKKTSFELIEKTTPPQFAVADLNQLGIKELLATGISDFKGSHAPRIQNITVASKLLDGIIIKPGEEFSLVTAIGEVDGAHGFAQEYVIKDNKTQKEYGGGLCQIGTTMFRGALRAGLPITERRNHSYIVSYYYPTGTDATIYGPHPDLRFVNDTPGHIMIQTHMEGTHLYYEFWGTSDGRTVSVTDPVPLYNIKQPPEPKTIETLELKPGVKRCTEKARIGADTYFTRTITPAGKEKKEEKFSSHYRPWGEVCEVGVEKLTVPSDASATPLSPDQQTLQTP